MSRIFVILHIFYINAKNNLVKMHRIIIENWLIMYILQLNRNRMAGNVNGLPCNIEIGKQDKKRNLNIHKVSFYNAEDGT